MGVGKVELQQGLPRQKLLGDRPVARLLLLILIVELRHDGLGYRDCPAAVPDDVADKLLIILIGNPDFAVFIGLLGQREAGASVDGDLEGGARKHLLGLTVGLPDDDFRVLGIGEHEGGQLGAAADFSRLPVSAVQQVARRGLHLAHLNRPGVLLVVGQELAVHIMVDDNGTIRSGGTKGTQVGTVDHDLEDGAGQRLFLTGGDLLDDDLGVGVVDKGELMHADFVNLGVNGNTLASPVGK